MKSKIVFNSEIREEVIDDIHGVEYSLKQREFDSLDVYIGIHYAAAEVARNYDRPTSIAQITYDSGNMLRRYLKRIECGSSTVEICSRSPGEIADRALAEYAKKVSKLPAVKRLYPEIVRQFRDTPEAKITAAYMVNGSVVIEVEYPDDCDYWR